MSTLDDKLAPVHLHEGRARRRLSTLRACAGYDGGNAVKPQRVTICPIDERITWRRVEGDRDADPMYELETETAP